MDPKVREFLRFVLSREGQEIIQKGGVYGSTKKIIVFDVLVGGTWWLSWENVCDVSFGATNATGRPAPIAEAVAKEVQSWPEYADTYLTAIKRTLDREEPDYAG